MNKILIPLLVGLLVLTGCAHGYVITLNNGERISAANKPHLDRGFYYFKDPAGRQRMFFAGKVKEIAPANMVSDDQPKFIPVQSK